MNTSIPVKNENELIAEFSGWYSLRTEHDVFWNESQPCTLNNWQHHSINLKFHYSWDSLLPAVNKFFDVEFGNQFDQWASHCANIKEALISLEIDRVRDRLVEGIKWYNQNSIAP